MKAGINEQQLMVNEQPNCKMISLKSTTRVAKFCTLEFENFLLFIDRIL